MDEPFKVIHLRHKRRSNLAHKLFCNSWNFFGKTEIQVVVKNISTSNENPEDEEDDEMESKRNQINCNLVNLEMSQCVASVKPKCWRSGKQP